MNNDDNDNSERNKSNNDDDDTNDSSVCVGFNFCESSNFFQPLQFFGTSPFFFLALVYYCFFKPGLLMKIIILLQKLLLSSLPHFPLPLFLPLRLLLSSLVH